MIVKFFLDAGAFEPVKAHEDDAGFDIRTPVDFTIRAWHSVSIDTGIHIALPKNSVGFIKSKSGLNLKYGITSDGTIDSGYTGSIKAILHNDSSSDVGFKRGDKITQLVVIEIPKIVMQMVEEFEETERGDNGFGSTGR